MKRAVFSEKLNRHRYMMAAGKAQPQLLLVVVAVVGFAWYLYANSPKSDSGIAETSETIITDISPISRQARALAEVDTSSTEAEENEQQLALATESANAGSAGTGISEPKEVVSTENMKEGDWARLIISELRMDGDDKADLEEVYENATAFSETGKKVDAYLLHFYAARQGHGPSAFILGALADPEHYESGNGLMDEPNPVQAHKWYSQAARSGAPEAKKRLAKLENWVEQEAKKGNLSAQRLLLQWR